MLALSFFLYMDAWDLIQVIRYVQKVPYPLIHLVSPVSKLSVNHYIVLAQRNCVLWKMKAVWESFSIIYLIL